jgi:hypothetical protein
LADVLPSATASESAAADANGGGALPNLSLNLKVGDRFPLLKTITQTLLQPSPQGEVSSTSALEMMMSITVEEIPEVGERQGQKRMGVKYHRVRFAQDLTGKHIEFDSQAPRGPIPLEALGYSGLVGNSFFFWLGPNNQIVDLVGFREFLERCLRDVPVERQQQVRTALAATSGAEGIANFVDDSIGLLPPQAVQVGDSWSTTRQVFEPLRMYISNKYTLRSIDANQAEVIIQGTIAPSAAYGAPDQPVRDLNVLVRGGRCDGTCLVDRRTGLPLQSRVEQTISMQVKLANEEFEQQKQTVTTIRAFPESATSATPVAAAPPAGLGVPSAFAVPSGSPGPNRPGAPGAGSSTVLATPAPQGSYGSPFQNPAQLPSTAAAESARIR